ncbi:ribonuclease H-like domain-containing protein [Tanacetum coccineum]
MFFAKKVTKKEDQSEPQLTTPHKKLVETEKLKNPKDEPETADNNNQEPYSKKVSDESKSTVTTVRLGTSPLKREYNEFSSDIKPSLDEAGKQYSGPAKKKGNIKGVGDKQKTLFSYFGKCQSLIYENCLLSMNMHECGYAQGGINWLFNLVVVMVVLEVGVVVMVGEKDKGEGINTVSNEDEKSANHEDNQNIISEDSGPLFSSQDNHDVSKTQNLRSSSRPSVFPKNYNDFVVESKSSWAMNDKLTSALVECGFVQSKSDYSLFIKKFDDLFTALLVYVDDIIITGIEVLETSNGICLNQRKYCLELIDEFGLLASKPSYIPMQSNISLLDIAYTVFCLSQFMHSPLKSHLKTSLKVVRYLKSSPGKGINMIKSFASGIDLQDTQIQTGQDVLIQGGLLLVTVFLRMVLLFLGKVRNEIPSLSLPQKLSIEL